VRKRRSVKRVQFLGGALALGLPGAAMAASLKSAVESAAAASSGIVGVYARSMAPGPPAIAYNADESFPTASIIKVLILVTLYRRAEQDPGILDKRIATPDSKIVAGSEMFDVAPHDAEYSVSTLAHAMIVYSDNTASNQLIDLLGFHEIQATAHACGLTSTRLRRHFMDIHAMLNHSENVSTPRDMGLLMYEIERGWREGLRTVASPLSCKKMIDIMLQQEDRDKIGRGIPHGVPLANKTGEITAVRNDIAIVDPYGDTPYVLAVLTKDLNDFSLGNRAIRHIARAVHASLYRA
jgi:beta-lactamase class A